MMGVFTSFPNHMYYNKKYNYDNKSDTYTAVQSQKAVSANFKIKQILPLALHSKIDQQS